MPEREIRWFLAKGYRFNREKGKWSEKGPLGVYVVGPRNGEEVGEGANGFVVAIKLYGTKEEAFCLDRGLLRAISLTPLRSLTHSPPFIF